MEVIAEVERWWWWSNDEDDDYDDEEEEEEDKDDGENDDSGDGNGDSDDYIAGADDKGDNINGNDNYRCIVRKKMTTMINKVINGKIWGVYTDTSRKWGGERREKWISILFTVGSSPGNGLKIWNLHRKGGGKRSCLLGNGVRGKFQCFCILEHLIKYGTHACVPEGPCQFLSDQGQTWCCVLDWPLWVGWLVIDSWGIDDDYVSVSAILHF